MVIAFKGSLKEDDSKNSTFITNISQIDINPNIDLVDLKGYLSSNNIVASTLPPLSKPNIFACRENISSTLLLNYVREYAPELLRLDGFFGFGATFHANLPNNILEYLKKEIKSFLPIGRSNIGFRRNYLLSLPIINNEHYEEFETALDKFQSRVLLDYDRFNFYNSISKIYEPRGKKSPPLFLMGDFKRKLSIDELYGVSYDKVSSIDDLSLGLERVEYSNRLEREILEDFLRDISDSVELTKKARSLFERKIAVSMRDSRYDFFQSLSEATSEFEETYFSILDRSRN